MNAKLILAALLGLPAPAASWAAEPPQFILPLACTPGTDCWIATYVDTDPKADQALDFTCGPRTYEAHQGTDFALRSRAEMEQGVNVLAALEGTILRTRDGETDTVKAKADLDKIHKDNKDCGNGVYIDHAKAGFPALTTLYCHMKEGSIKLKPGDAVKAGDVLGQVGQSGFAEFPHLHFGVIWEGGYIDPFTGMTMNDGCGKAKRRLWKDDKLSYVPVALYDGGFRNAPPDFAAIQGGEKNPEQLSAGGPALVFWTALFGVREGDEITLTIHDPGGVEFIRRDITQEVTRPRQYYFTGRELKGRTIPAGVWSGQITLRRAGIPDQTRAFGVSVK